MSQVMDNTLTKGVQETTLMKEELQEKYW